jgi:aminoglycoside 3-N-acetyltransferase
LTELIDIGAALREVGVSPDDWILIHGDAGVAAQLRHIEPNRRLPFFFEQLLDFVDGGTLLVPAFSYSFTKNEDFDVNVTPSDVGLFSEAFRLLPGVARTNHPIFSFSVIGPGSKAVLGARLDDCFGQGTVFDLAYKNNAKIVFLGSQFSRATFVHYVEQQHGVKYRYPKTFCGDLIEGGTKIFQETNYLVRDLTIASSCDLRLLKQLAIDSGALSFSCIGRFPILSISASDFFDLASDLLNKTEYALIEQGVLNDAV